MIESYDVIVLGGGPAGSAAALSLVREGVSVAIIERSQYDEERIGETLLPNVKTLLTSLGVWNEFVREGHHSAPTMCASWGSGYLRSQDHIYNPYGPGWQVDRRRFDDWLARCAEREGARLHTAAKVESAERNGKGNWLIEVVTPGGRYSLQSRFLMDATGRSSNLTRSQGGKRIVWDKLVGVIKFLTPCCSPGSDTPALIEAVEDGWWYSAVVPESRLVVAYMTDADLYSAGCAGDKQFWEHQLERSAHTLMRVSSYGPSDEVRIAAANTSRLEQVTNENWIAIGDAAASLDPLSGQGVYAALQAGMRGAQAVLDLWKGHSETLSNYPSQLFRDFDIYLRQRTTYYSLETRWPNAPFWSRRRDTHVETNVVEVSTQGRHLTAP